MTGFIIIFCYMLAGVSLLVGIFWNEKEEPTKQAQHRNFKQMDREVSKEAKKGLKEKRLKELNAILKKKSYVEISPTCNGEDVRLDLGRSIDVLLAESVVDMQTESNTTVSPLIQLIDHNGELYDYRLEGTTVITNDYDLYISLIKESE